jgi:FixJ family two-component response regulator
MVYGYCQKEFFEKQFKSEKKYQAAIKALEKKCPRTLAEDREREIQELLQEITSRSPDSKSHSSNLPETWLNPSDYRN